MEDKMRITAPDVEQNIVINIQGEEKLKDFAKSLNTIARGNQLHNYWKSQEELINDVIEAYKRFNKIATDSNAEDLVNNINALRAVADKTDVSSLFSNFSEISAALSKAERQVGEVVGELSPEIFKSAFESFDLMKAEGVDLEKTFQKLSVSGDVTELQNRIDDLQVSLRNAKERSSELYNELEELRDSSGFDSLNSRIAQLEGELEDVRERMEREFESFLSANDIDRRDRWGDERFEEYFENIRDGSMTAKEAIARFKAEWSNLFIGSDARMNNYEVDALSARLEDIMSQIESIRAEANGGGIGQAVAGNEADISPIVNVLGELSDAAKNIAEDAPAAHSALTDLVQAVGELGKADANSLHEIVGVFGGIGRLNGLKVSGAAMSSIATVAESLSKISNLGKVGAISSVDLSGFSNLKISKASLNNLATYLPQIASVDVGNLTKLSHVDLTNFNNVKVSKSSVENLLSLAEITQTLNTIQGRIGEVKTPTAAAANSAVVIPTLTTGLGDLTKQTERFMEGASEATSVVSVYNDALTKTTTTIHQTVDDNNELAESYRDVTVDYKAAAKEALHAGALEKRAISLSATIRKAIGSDMYQGDANEANRNALNGYADSVDNLLQSFRNGTVDTKQFESDLSKLSVAFTELNAARAGDYDTLKGNYAEEQKAMAKVADLYKQATGYLKSYSAAKNGRSAVNYKAIEDESKVLEKLQAKLQAGEITRRKYDEQVAKSTLEIKKNAQAIRDAGEDHVSFGSKIVDTIKKFSSWFSVTRIVMAAYRAIKQLISVAVELDDAMTQLRVVTNETSEAYEKFSDTVAKMAQRTGSSIKDLISSTTTYARLGYDLSQSSTLAEYTAMLQNVGDIKVEDAQNAITAIVKAFDDVDVNNIESVMDKLVTVGNNFPISVSQIAEGMNNASSALSAAGNTFDQSVALLTAANTTTQNAAKSATGLRTIAARIRNTKTELDDLGETMTRANYDELVQQLTKYNVSLMDVNGEYRSTYDIMADIAKQWEYMTSGERAALATVLSGTRQQAIFYSIIEQFREASGSMDAMAGSAGALQEAYDEFMQSTTAHINQFKASTQGLASNLFTREDMNAFVDLGTILVNIVNSLANVIKMFGGLRTVLPIAGLVAVATNFETIFNYIKGLPIMAHPAVAAFTVLSTILLTLIANHKEALEVAKELKEEYDEMAKHLESLEEKLKQVENRQKELIGISEERALTNAEKEELDNLTAINRELALQIQNERELAAIRAKDSNDALVRAFNSPEYASTYAAEMYSKIRRENESLINEYEQWMLGATPAAWSGLSADDITEKVNTYFDVMKQLDMYESHLGENIGFGARVDELIAQYNDAIALGEEGAEQQQAARKELVEMMGSLKTEYLDQYINGDTPDEIYKSWQNIYNTIAETIYGSEEFGEETDDALSEALHDAEEVIKSFDKIKSKFDEMSKGLKSLGSIYKDVDDQGAFSFDSLISDDFVESFSGLGDVYDDFIKTISESPDDIEKCQNAFNNLATAYIDQSGILKDVTKETRAYTIGLLEQYGVANATKVVDEKLAEAEAKAAVEAKHGTDATYDEILAMLSESKASDETRGALARLASAKIGLNNITISTSADIDNIMNLAKAAGASVKILSQLAVAKELFAKSDYILAMSEVASNPATKAALIADATILNKMANAAVKTGLSGAGYIGADIDFSGLTDNGGGGGDSGGGGSGGGSSSNSDNWFIKKYKKYNHQISMGLKSISSYLEWLDGAYQQAYTEGIITLDDFYKYEEEVYEKSQALFKDYLSDSEHEVSIRKEYEGQSAKIIGIYQKLMSSIEDELKKAREYGLDDADDYIQELQSKWLSYSNAIKDLQDDVTSSAESATQKLVEMRVDMLKQEIKDEKDALKKRLDMLKDFYDKQKDMLREQADEEKYLEDQAEKRKAVADIQAQLAQLEFDNSAWAQKKREELNAELANAQKELDSFERDHAMDVAEKELDLLYTKQEEALNKQIDGLEEQENDTNGLYEKALEDIRSGSKGLYDQMVQWNKEYGDGIKETVTDAWNEAYKALKEYANLYGTLYEGISLPNSGGYDRNTLPSGLIGKRSNRGGYASGTSSATRGLHRIDENGSETIFELSNGAKYRMFSGGEKVLTAKASNFLYDFANNGRQFLSNVLSSLSSAAFAGMQRQPLAATVNMGDIIIQGSADNRTVSEIRRAQRASVVDMLKSFDKLGK